MKASALLAVLALTASACDSDGPLLPDGSKADDPSDRPVAQGDPNRDLLSTAVDVDVASHTGIATVTAASAVSRGLSLEVGDLEIHRVFDDFGDLEFHHDGALLEVGVPATGDDTVVSISYTYSERGEFEGALDNGITLVWPYFCGNLFPCKSDPADGLTFELELSGVSSDEVAVFPQTIPSDSPSYMLAWAIGDYTYEKLGDTSAGTEVGVYYLPGGDDVALAGTANLAELFDWYETSLGAYSFGDKVASVAAPWGPGAFGGMEHHPLWHVGTVAMGDEETHSHEAAHGWYGNGVRIACWEDFVLSEGTVSYLTARSIEEVVGASAGEEIWTGYRDRLQGISELIAWPDGCGVVDILDDGLFSSAPYMKGAFFFKSLAAKVGVQELDQVLADFYADHVGQAATFQDLLDRVELDTGYDANACALAWLRASELPTTEVCP